MNNQLFVATDRWRAIHPGSRAALVLYRNLTAAADTPALAEMKRELEASLRAKWETASKQDLLADPTLAAYERYDRAFGQSYHVAMQIRSIAQKGKPIPARNVLVEALFMTELAGGVLAAAQDVDQITMPITIDSTDGIEQYVRYDGVSENCKPGDQVMYDANRLILTSITQGPTSFGLVGPDTTSVAFCFYFPSGVELPVIAESLDYLHQCVLSGNPTAERVEIVQLSAQG